MFILGSLLYITRENSTDAVADESTINHNNVQFELLGDLTAVLQTFRNIKLNSCTNMSGII